MTALSYAAYYGRLKCVEALIAAGADCAAKSNVRCCRLPRPPAGGRLAVHIVWTRPPGGSMFAPVVQRSVVSEPTTHPVRGSPIPGSGT